jgi:hypothetical protein
VNSGVRIQLRKKYEVKSKRFSDSFTDSGNEKKYKELEHSIHVSVEFVLFWSSHFQNCPNSTLKNEMTFDFIFPFTNSGNEKKPKLI